MLITTATGCAALRLRLPALNILALCLASLSVFAAAGWVGTGPNLAGLSAASLRVPATAVALHFLRDIVRQFCGRVSRIFSFILLGDVFSSPLRLISIFYSFPSVIDFVGSGRFSNLGPEFQMLAAMNFRRNQSQLIAIVSGKFAAEFLGIVVAVDVDSPAFLSA
jgi:hypothetical protein